MGLLLALLMRVSSLDRPMSIYFENEKPYNPKLGQILHFSTPFAVKIEEGWATCLSRNEGQSRRKCYIYDMFLHFETTMRQRRLVLKSDDIPLSCGLSGGLSCEDAGGGHRTSCVSAPARRRTILRQ